MCEAVGKSKPSNIHQKLAYRATRPSDSSTTSPNTTSAPCIAAPESLEDCEDKYNKKRRPSTVQHTCGFQASGDAKSKLFKGRTCSCTYLSRHSICKEELESGGGGRLRGGRGRRSERREQFRRLCVERLSVLTDYSSGSPQPCAVSYTSVLFISISWV